MNLGTDLKCPKVGFIKIQANEGYGIIGKK